jgi:hypothetical protein
MDTKQNAGARQSQTETKPPAQNASIDHLDTDVGTTSDDVNFRWNVVAVRGKDNKPLAHLQGSSTILDMLAPEVVWYAPWRAEREIREKITEPMVTAIQDELQRNALAKLGKE